MKRKLFFLLIVLSSSFFNKHAECMDSDFEVFRELCSFNYGSHQNNSVFRDSYSKMAAPIRMNFQKIIKKNM